MLGVVIGVVARRVLVAELGPDVARKIWQRTCALHPALRRVERASREATPPSAGVSVLVRKLAWDHALYTALQAHGLAKPAAAALIERISWALARPGIALAWRAAGLVSREPIPRVRRVVDALFATVFGAPFARALHAAPEVVAFDVTRCPLAEELAARGVPELTRAAACALDHRMAAAWGVQLERTGTLAEGAAVCDFRFVPLARAATAANGASRAL